MQVVFQGVIHGFWSLGKTHGTFFSYTVGLVCGIWHVLFFTILRIVCWGLSFHSSLLFLPTVILQETQTTEMNEETQKQGLTFQVINKTWQLFNILYSALIGWCIATSVSIVTWRQQFGYAQEMISRPKICWGHSDNNNNKKWGG